MSKETNNFDLEYQFLQHIFDKLKDTFSEDFFWQYDCSEKAMILKITSTKKIEQANVHKIIKILVDVDLAKFDSLRALGWCSAYNLTECRARYLEFEWVNMSRLLKLNKVDLCSCLTWNYKFNG